MSIEYIKYEDYLLSCDICGLDCDELFECFHDAVYYKKTDTNKWTARKIKGEWHDLCPECAKRYKEERGRL